jgi:hypothetical protein
MARSHHRLSLTGDVEATIECRVYDEVSRTASGHDRDGRALPAPAEIDRFAWRDITSRQCSLRPAQNKQ